MPKKRKQYDFTILVDSREQTPYTFSFLNPQPKVIYRGLKTADYSIDGYEDRICIERKTLADLYGSTGYGRKRFEAEFNRMKNFEYSALVIEAGLGDIFKNPPSFSKPNRAKSVFHTLLSWSVYYKVFVWACPDRTFSEKLTYYLLEKWWKKNVEQI